MELSWALVEKYNAEARLWERALRAIDHLTIAAKGRSYKK